MVEGGRQAARGLTLYRTGTLQALEGRDGGEGRWVHHHSPLKNYDSFACTVLFFAPVSTWDAIQHSMAWQSDSASHTGRPIQAWYRSH